MLLLVATEASLFGVLIASYFYLRFKAVAWPPPADAEPALLRPLVNNAVLVASAPLMFLAGRAAARGRNGLLVALLAGALLLGSAFFALQLDSFVNSWRTFRPQDDAYASLVYTIVGAHWIHVGAGLLLLAYTLIRAVLGRFTPERHTGVEVTALYWYFLSVLAVAIVATTLSPRL
jgi:heme/copper-type cytochrome/quinol oxidase subunit 3